MVFTPSFWMFSASLLISAGVLAYSLVHLRTLPGRVFYLLALLVLILNAAVIMEVAAQYLELKVLFARIQWTAHAFIPAVWLFLALAYTGRKKHPLLWVLLASVPAATGIFIWFIPIPSWYWGNPERTVSITAAAVMDYDYRQWVSFVHVSYILLVSASALFVLLRSLLHVHPLYRRQASALLFALLLPTAAFIFHLFGYAPIPGMNSTAAAGSIAGIAAAASLFRYRFLEFIPMARDTVLDRMDTGILICDRLGRILDFNRSASQITGITSRDLGRPAEHLQAGSFSRVITDLAKQNASSQELSVQGDPDRHFDVHASAIRSPAGEVLAVIIYINDCTEREQLLQKIRELTETDSLTGLHNRDTLLTLGQEMLKDDEPVSLIMLDIDDMQAFNDAQGTRAGDRAIAVIGSELRRCTRPQDILGRFSGDEFVIIMPGMTRGAAVTAALSLHRSIEKISWDSVQLTVSIGVVSARSPEELNLLLAAAGRALSRAKQQGKNQVVSVSI